MTAVGGALEPVLFCQPVGLRGQGDRELPGLLPSQASYKCLLSLVTPISTSTEMAKARTISPTG